MLQTAASDLRQCRMSVIRLQQIIRTEAPAKLLSQVAPIRPIQILFQQFSQRAYMVYTSYARIKHKNRMDAGWFVVEAP